MKVPVAQRGLISPLWTQAGREWTPYYCSLGEVVVGSRQLNTARV